MSVVKRLEDNYSEERVLSEVVYSHDNARVVRFYLLKDQEVKPHISNSSVLISVLKGKLIFYSGEALKEDILNQGDSIFYEPKELHGFKALDNSVVEAVITPNPTSHKLRIT